MNSVSTATKPARSGSPLDDKSRPLPRFPPGAIVALALVLAILAGHFFAGGHVAFGAAIVLGVCVGPLAFLDLTLALALYVAILFIQDAQALGVGPNTVGVLVLLGWAGTLVTRSARPIVLREQSRLLLALGMFALWLTLSLVWASDPGATGIGLQTWLLAILAFILAVTTLHSPRDVAIIGVAFIVGSVISVAFGAASGGLSPAAESVGEATAQGGRFTGGGGDPNVQAAGYIVAMFLCAGFWGLARRRIMRVALVLAFIVVAIGFFATQSRGGLLALAVAALAGLVLLPRQRKRLLGLTAAAGIGLGVVAIVNSSAISRMTNIGGGSSGRNDLWQVAWTIFKRHPLNGIALNDFETVEPHYALSSGTLSRVELIADKPHLVHNVYLQLLTETGIVGFVLFLLIVIGSMRASWLAARRFDAGGHTGYGDLARAALMGSIAMLAAQFFISDGDDWRLWILLGLGPVLLSLARREAPADAILSPSPRLRRRAQRAAVRSGRRAPLARKKLGRLGAAIRRALSRQPPGRARPRRARSSQ
jgi:O-antigen ligase